MQKRTHEQGDESVACREQGLEESTYRKERDQLFEVLFYALYRMHMWFQLSKTLSLVDDIALCDIGLCFLYISCRIKIWCFLEALSQFTYDSIGALIVSWRATSSPLIFDAWFTPRAGHLQKQHGQIYISRKRERGVADFGDKEVRVCPNFERKK